MKDKFSAEEWEKLKMLPFRVFTMIAGADGTIDEKEIAKMNADLKDAGLYKDEMHRELMIDAVRSNPTAMAQRAVAEIFEFKEKALEVKGILKAKLTDDEYQRCIGSIWISGLGIARASGGGFMKGGPVSKEEELVLNAVAGLFDLKASSMKKFFSD